jgi:hypothetical protein
MHGVDMLELPPIALHLASFKPPEVGHERDIVQRAIDGFAGADPSWFPLLSSKTLEALVANGEIDTGSFTYVVCAQYLQTLALALDAKGRKEEASVVFWERLSQIAAAVSLFMFPFGPLPALLRAGLWIGDMLLLGRSYLTAWQQLNQIDGLLGQTLAEASPAAYALASIGDLLGTRRELIDNVSEQTAIVFVVTIISRADPKLMSAGRVRSAVELTHGLLTAHGYYQDVQILLTAASGADE